MFDSSLFGSPSQFLFGVDGQGLPRGQKNPLCVRIPERFTAIRQRTGMSARRISLDAGLSNSVAAAVERGAKSAPLSTIERLAAALGVPPGWLAYGYEGSEPFRERYPRPIFEPADPNPDDKHRVFRALHEGFPTRLQQARERSGLDADTLHRRWRQRPSVVECRSGKGCAPCRYGGTNGRRARSRAELARVW